MLLKNGSRGAEVKQLKAFPEGGYVWHLGENGSHHMHTHAVGIEVCNFDYLQEGGYSKWNNVNEKWIWIPKTSSKFYSYVAT